VWNGNLIFNFKTICSTGRCVVASTADPKRPFKFNLESFEDSLGLQVSDQDKYYSQYYDQPHRYANYSDATDSIYYLVQDSMYIYAVFDDLNPSRNGNIYRELCDGLNCFNTSSSGEYIFNYFNLCSSNEGACVVANEGKPSKPFKFSLVSFEQSLDLPISNLTDYYENYYELPH